MSLALYNKKRKFGETSEPRGQRGKSNLRALVFVVQKHWASRLHYDFRLEMAGVMKSWAVPKEPSLDPAVKRLAMQVEDHPISYNKFEGRIPKGNYGAGVVKIWDKGVYSSLATADRKESEKKLLRGLARGEIKFAMLGKRLRGGFALIKMAQQRGKGNEWLLIKEKDEYAKTEKEKNKEEKKK